MRLKLVLALSLILPIGASADDHQPSSTVAAVWECTLNDGATANRCEVDRLRPAAQFRAFARALLVASLNPHPRLGAG